MSKRAERRYRTRKVIARRMRDAERFGLLPPKQKYPWDKLCYSGQLPNETWEQFRQRRIKEMARRCKHRHPLDCGRSHCFCCHYDKMDNVPTKQEVIADLHLKESVDN